MPYDERPVSVPLDVEECRTAIWLERGNVTKAAERLKISSNRLRRFIENSPRLQEEQKESREQLLDIAEDNAYEALTDEVDASRRDQMTRYVLTNLGGSRGYGNGGGGKAGVNLNISKGRLKISWEGEDMLQSEFGDAHSEPDAIEGEFTREAAE